MMAGSFKPREFPSSEPAAPELSVIVAVAEVPRLSAMVESYRDALDGLGRSYEFICVTDGAEVEVIAQLEALARTWPNLKVLAQRPWLGDDPAMDTAVWRAQADLVLVLPGWPEVDSTDLSALFEALDDNDMAVAVRRRGEPEGSWQKLRKGALDRLLRGLFGHSLTDPFCRVRLARRSVLDDVTGFGVRQHFVPVIAAQRGYRVVETEVKPATLDREAAQYVFKPMGHLRALIDALALFVVLKFLRRPLRFFGAIGVPLFLIGSIFTAVLVMYRLFGDTPLADRPALIFAVLMVVLGIQIIAIGLVGEIIIFAHSRRMKQYSVRSVIRNGRAGPDAAEQKP